MGLALRSMGRVSLMSLMSLIRIQRHFLGMSLAVVAVVVAVVVTTVSVLERSGVEWSGVELRLLAPCSVLLAPSKR